MLERVVPAADSAAIGVLTASTLGRFGIIG